MRVAVAGVLHAPTGVRDMVTVEFFEKPDSGIQLAGCGCGDAALRKCDP